LLLELIGRIPKNGEEARFGKFKFLVISVVNNRIEKVKVTNDN
jgi:CBS domain containing-hemolysin-like protein